MGTATRVPHPAGDLSGLVAATATTQAAWSSLRRRQRSRGLKMPAGVMMPVMSSAGVTSKAGFRAPLVGLATRT